MIEVPAETPDRVPAADMVATAVLLLLQVPPDVLLVREIEEAAHTDDEPDIAATDGSALMVTY
jgi:hypothetical protein